MSQTPKSYEKHNNPIVDYCASHTVIQSPLQKELFKITLEKVPMAIMMGAPEVLTFGENFIRNFNHKKVLDVGTFTGCSALAWAQALPDDGEVYTFDIDLKNYNTFGVPILSKCQKTFSKIKAIEGEALKSLEKLIESGHSDTFDFAFIDADKGNYPNYYDRCVKLLKKGGVIFVDNVSIIL